MTIYLDVPSFQCDSISFDIDNKPADITDFGELVRNGADQPDFGCDGMYFVPHDYTPTTVPAEVLTKYSITEADFFYITKRLVDELHFSSCAYCD